ncbi:hypothetical protein [Komagataeibacter diospyri]|uniref:hypothetical protein n=1 Tax=Komagataeibacter diospyri TaxID=1932662 RepID=UPI001143F142|nr:hypothetical protein [Komagataeibacter diospyri]
MQQTSDPNITAEIFAKQAFGGQVPIQVRSLPEIKGKAGSWVATFADGTIVTYRPAGAASIRTPSDMATVQINNKIFTALYRNKVIKFKFPSK